MPTKEEYWQNPEKYREKARERYRIHPPDPERKRAIDRRYKEGHRKLLSEKQKIWIQNNPKKWRARRIIEFGMRRGLNRYPLTPKCELCPDNDKRKATQHHHFDYDYPRLYVSVCASCHQYADRT